ncbi:MAG: N-acyl-L-homoserine lactone synthetase [Sulfitobacter sp.]|jgi:acyl homoserine lactone synthase|nr:N-acyl-L-homoserine lactone synthetase [Sulfitobacter sp.]
MGFHKVKTSQDAQTVQASASSKQNSDAHKVISANFGFASRIEETVVSISNQHLYGQLYADNLKARKQVFIDQKAWNLPQTDGMEFDQYDTPQSRSVVIHEYGRVLAGVRLLPTTARCGCYSYMLRDAQLGMLPDIPDYVLYERAPVMSHVWEATRLFLTKSEPAERRLIIQTKLIKAMARAAAEHGATHVIGIVPAVFQRWMNRLGLNALPMGPKLNISGDHTQAAVMHVAG